MTDDSKTRYFSKDGARGQLFWNISTNGREFGVEFGRIRLSERHSRKISREFTDESAAKAHANREIRRKTKSGYRESIPLIVPRVESATHEMIDVLALRELETKSLEILLEASESRDQHQALAANFMLGGAHRQDYIDHALRRWAETSRKTLTSGLPAFMLNQAPLNEGLELSSQCIEIIQEMVDSRNPDLEHIRIYYDWNEDAGNFGNRSPLTTLARFGESWNPISVPLRKIHIDRRRGCLGGPLFTSKSFPWPSVNGCLLEPIMQVDLRDLSELKGRPFGDGLLQLWRDIDCEVRVIPRAAVDHEPLAPIPIEEIKDQLWNDSEDWLSSIETAIQIIGYEGPLFSCAKGIFLEEDRMETELGRKFVDTHSRLKKNSWKGAHHYHTWHLFGVFDPIQYDLSQKPEVLVAMESSFSLVLWGDCGNGQVFYEFNESGNPVFTSSWSS